LKGDNVEFLLSSMIKSNCLLLAEISGNHHRATYFRVKISRAVIVADSGALEYYLLVLYKDTPF